MAILWQDNTNTVEASHIDTVSGTVWLKFSVKTRNFGGTHTFFIPTAEIKKHIDTLKEMYNRLDGKLDLCDGESDAVIHLHKNSDKWFFSGQFGCSWEGNRMLFNVLADQTVIQILLTFLENIL